MERLGEVLPRLDHLVQETPSDPHFTGRWPRLIARNRTVLLLNSEPLPWADWAAEFRDKMPAEISALMEEVASGSSSSNHGQAIRERLKAIAPLLNLSRYPPTPTSAIAVEGESVTVGGRGATPHNRGPAATNGSGRRSTATPGSPGGVYGLFLATEGGVPDELVSGSEPECTWVSLEEGTRSEGDMEDRAAKYLPEQHLLLINGDFRVFTDMIGRWSSTRTTAPRELKPLCETWSENGSSSCSLKR